MVLDPAACVVAIKERFNKRPDNPILWFLKNRAKLKSARRKGYMIARYEDLVIVYFTAWNNMLSQVEALLVDEVDFACERKSHHVLFIYPKDDPPSASLRRRLDLSRPD